jgi:hypothetical protein
LLLLLVCVCRQCTLLPLSLLSLLLLLPPCVCRQCTLLPAAADAS